MVWVSLTVCVLFVCVFLCVLGVFEFLLNFAFVET